MSVTMQTNSDPQDNQERGGAAAISLLCILGVIIFLAVIHAAEIARTAWLFIAWLAALVQPHG